MDYRCELHIQDENTINYTDTLLDGEYTGEVLKDELIRKTVDRFNYWVENHDKNCKREDLEILGMHLYNILFDKENRGQGMSVKDAFETTYKAFKNAQADNPDARLRLVLIFDKKARNLASYPWEFIFMPTKPQGFFFAGEKTELILTRFVPESISEDTIKPDDSPLKILIAFSHPSKLRQINAEDVIKAIKDLQKCGPIEVEVQNNPTYDTLKEQIEDFHPHVFHFIGHGEPGKIALFRKQEKEIETDIEYSERGDFEWIDSGTVSRLFGEHPPRLVFLHACNGAKSGSLESFKSTAIDLVYSNIPAVVAMQYEINNTDAAFFAETFYKEISQGKPIDEAVNLGRHKLGQKLGQKSVKSQDTSSNWSDRRFGTPVVYLQSEKAIILPGIPAESPRPPAETEVLSRPVPCPNRKCREPVFSTDRVCANCGHLLMECPSCKKVMSETLGICVSCGYGSKTYAEQEASPKNIKPDVKKEKLKAKAKGGSRKSTNLPAQKKKYTGSSS